MLKISFRKLCKEKLRLVIGLSEAFLKDLDKSANIQTHLMMKLNIVEKLMENLERNGLIKSNLNFKKRTQLSLYPIFLMEIKLSLKVMQSVYIFATGLIEKIFLVEMLMNKLPYILL